MKPTDEAADHDCHTKHFEFQEKAIRQGISHFMIQFSQLDFGIFMDKRFDHVRAIDWLTTETTHRKLNEFFILDLR